MSVKRCILRFFAIILFVLGMQSVAYAACKTSTTVSYTPYTSYYCASNIAEPTATPKTATSCTSCEEGYSLRLDLLTTDDYECGASSCSSQGLPDKSECRQRTAVYINSCVGSGGGSGTGNSCNVPLDKWAGYHGSESWVDASDEKTGYQPIEMGLYDGYCSFKMTKNNIIKDDFGYFTGPIGDNEYMQCMSNYECDDFDSYATYTDCHKNYYLRDDEEHYGMTSYKYSGISNTGTKCVKCPDGAHCPGGTFSPTYKVNFFNLSDIGYSVMYNGTDIHDRLYIAYDETHDEVEWYYLAPPNVFAELSLEDIKIAKTYHTTKAVEFLKKDGTLMSVYGTTFIDGDENLLYYIKNDDTIDVVAELTVNKYKITLNQNGGTGGYNEVYEIYGSKWTYDDTDITQVQIPTKANSVFMGYSDTPNGMSFHIDKAGTLPTPAYFNGDATLYAGWSACTCTTGTGVSSCTVTGVLNNQCQYSSGCKPGYNGGGTFSGTAGVGTNTASNCSANTYIVVYDAKGGKGTTAPSGHKYGSAKSLTANGFTRTGYTFAGWNTKADGTGKAYKDEESVINLTLTNNGTVNLYAQWTECPAGYYCPGDNGSYICPLGSFSAGGATKCTVCTNGKTTSTIKATSCDATCKNNNGVKTWMPPSLVEYDGSLHVYEECAVLECNDGYEHASTGEILPSDSQNGICEPNEYTITLDDNGATQSGTTTLYTRYGDGAYLDNNLTKQMATSGNKIQVPTLTYTVKFHTDGDNTISDSYSHYSFTGYYQYKSTSSTQYISSLGFITQAGIDAAKSYTNNTTWYAQWNTANSKIKLPAPTKIGFKFNGWYTARIGGTKIGDAGFAYLPTSDITLYAQWEANTLNIEYLDGSETLGTQTCTYGTECKVGENIELPEKTGYSFNGWFSEQADGIYKNGDDLNLDNFIKKSNRSITFTALWKANTLSITYTNGSETLGTQTCEYGKECKVGKDIVLPEKTGYSFTGWVSEKADGTYKNGDDLNLDNFIKESNLSITFTALWTPNNYDIDFEANCKTTSTGGMPTQERLYDDNEPLLENAFSCVGYTFAGWNTNADGTGTSYANGTTDNLTTDNLAHVDLYAQWKPIEYTITYNENGGSTVADRTYTIETETFSLPNTTKTDYRFAGWYDASTGGNKVTQITKGTTGNKTLYARWTSICNKVTITYSENGEQKTGTYYMTTDDNTTMYSDSNCTSEREFGPGAFGKDLNGEFDSIVDYDDMGSTCIDDQYLLTGECKVTSDVQWVAVYTCNSGYHGHNNYSYAYGIHNCEPNTYTLTYDCGVQGHFTDPYRPYEQDITYHDNFTSESGSLCAKTGYEFLRWIDPQGKKISENTKYQWTYTTNQTFTAMWEPVTYDILFDGNGGSGSMTSQNHTYDVEYTLPQNTFTRTGYIFTGWNTTEDGTGTPYTDRAKVKNLANKSNDAAYLYAQWKPAPITITYQCEGETVDTQTCYVTDTECKLKEPTCTKNGYNFDLWSVQAGTYADYIYIAGGNLNDMIEYLATQDGFWTDGANITATAQWKEITCGAGQYLDGNNCEECPAGSSCPGDNVQHACPVEFTSASDLGLTPMSPAGATSSNDCYIEKPCPNGNGTQICNFRSSDVSDYIDCNACEYTSCDTWFELVDGNSRCQLKPKFTITTTPDTADFFMHIAAAGEFIIDWGGAGTVTVGNNTTAETIGNVSYITKKINDRETLSSTKITYTYDKPGEYTIKISGLATGYYKDKALPVYSAFRLSDLDGKGDVKTNERVQGIYGSLSAIFPTLANGTNPSFEASFDGCSSIQSTIPTDLFTGLYGEPQIRMFRHTFQGCEKLDGTIPENLFAGIKTNKISEFLFYNTFGGCAELDGEIPSDLFKNFSGAPAKAMFCNTFRGCKSLTGIGEGLFDSISGVPASSMFADTFKGTKNITSIPEGLFVNISGKPANGMFYGTFYGSGITSIPDGLFDSISGAPAENMFFGTFGETQLTTPDGQKYALPADLFKNIEGTSQKGMFDQTFIKCSGLEGYILPEMFAGISDTSVGMNQTFEGTNIATYCPKDMYVSDSWTAEEKNSAGVSIGSFTRVACDGCPFDTPYSVDQNKDGINSCYANCTLECTQQECPANSVGCKNVQSSTDGQTYYGSTCNAPASTCKITFSCEPGYKITADGTACEKETYTATYDCNDGVGGKLQSIVFQDTFVIDNEICTRENHDFLGYTIDGQDVTESFVWEWASDKTLVAKWKKNIVTCNDGEYLPANKEVCEPCPENHACVEDTFKINQSTDQGNHPCPVNSFADGTGNSQCECFEQIDMDGFVALRQEQYVEYYEQCEYNNGITDDGHKCEVQNGTCNITECKSGYEMVGGTCKPCRREHALSYMDDGYCTVKTCTDGFHPISDSCEPNTQECDIKNITNAIAAQQIWNYANGKYGDCIVTECANGYHISENACVQNNKGCEVDNGTGIMTWNEKTQKWNDCMVVSCDSGFTNDPTETNETWKPCGECNNKYAANGELAVSRYGKECEIEECMYKDEKYILENNECRLICDTHEDETGRRYWDERSKRCVHECDPGYNMW